MRLVSSAECLTYRPRTDWGSVVATATRISMASDQAADEGICRVDSRYSNTASQLSWAMTDPRSSGGSWRAVCTTE